MAEKLLEEQIGELLMKRGWHLALAESCTGGLVSHRITNVPGSSSYYLGGITAYANETKMRLLGVRTETLEEHGAVSRETVLEMARGARQTLQADIAMSISGIAGPGGETPGKPVGLTWIGLSAPDWENAWSYIWSGNRLQVKEQSAEEVLRLLRDYLSGSLAPG
jgi:PncC family amidohydrolase